MTGTMERSTPRPGTIAECGVCRRADRKIFCRGMCHTCYQRICRHDRPYPKMACAECKVVRQVKARNLCWICFASPEIRVRHKKRPDSREPTPGKGDFIVVLCKPGDSIQDEIRIMRCKTADAARQECKDRNMAARRRGSKSKSFYFVNTDRSTRLPWVDRMLAKLEIGKGEE